MRSASGASARFRFWSSSTALAILAACREARVVRADSSWHECVREGLSDSEGMRIRWCGRASNPVGDVNRFPVGSTPATFRHIRAVRAQLRICFSMQRRVIW